MNLPRYGLAARGTGDDVFIPEGAADSDKSEIRSIYH